jgi:hypothetical protein
LASARQASGQSFHSASGMSGIVELWLALADFPENTVGANVVTKAAIDALLLDLQLAVRQESHRDFAVARVFRHEHGDVVLDSRFA